jgi:hypothetical protein
VVGAAAVHLNVDSEQIEPIYVPAASI